MADHEMLWYDISVFLQNLVTYCWNKQGRILRVCLVCGAHPVKLNMTWHFPDRAIKVKSQKSYKDTCVLSSPKVCAIGMYSTALLFEETLANIAFAVVSCAVSRSEWILLPCCFYSTNQGVQQSRRTPAALENSQSTRNSRRTADCFCSCDLRCSWAGCILLSSSSIWQPWVCAIRSARLGSTARI